MKNTGICPKCSSKEVYFDLRTLNAIDTRGKLLIARKKFAGQEYARLAVYVCINCGYFEEYLREEDLKDTKIREQIQNKWKKVPNQD